MKNLVLIVMLFSCAISVAQEDSSKNTDDAKSSELEDVKNGEEQPWTYKSAQKIYKTNPLDLLSAVPTIAADMELKLKDPTISLQWGAGIIPTFIQPSVGNRTDSQFDAMNGYMVRFEPRFFIMTGKHHYFSTEVYFRHLYIKDEVAIGMEGDDNGNFAYFMNQNMKFHRFSTRLTLKYGFQHVFKNRFAVEAYTGLSLRANFVQSRQDKLPEGGVQMPGQNMLGWTLLDNHRAVYPIPVFGIKLGFSPKHKK